MGGGRKVGRFSIGVSKLGVASIFRTMLGREYKLGGSGETIGEPFDCFGMLIEYVKLRYKVDLLQYSKSYCDDYVAFYKMDRDVSFILLKDLLDDKLLKVDPAYKLPGDILFVTADDKNAVGIYGGNGSLMVSSETTGSVILGINFYKIEDVYRWPLSSR